MVALIEDIYLISQFSNPLPKSDPVIRDPEYPVKDDQWPAFAIFSIVEFHVAKIGLLEFEVRSVEFEVNFDVPCFAL